MLINLLKKLAAFISLLLFSAFSWAMSFESDIEFSFNDERFSGRFRYDRDKVRMDVKDRHGNEETIILREDTHTYWFIGQNKTYNEIAMKHTIAASTGIVGQHIDPAKVQRHFMGVATLDGRTVNKYRVIIDSYGTPVEFIEWQWPGQPVPLKVATPEGNSVIEYKNVLFRPQEYYRFQLPKGLKKTTFRMPKKRTGKA
ncbi:hypothetical protein OFAG_00773 [Oxalobacter formigenes HOxBLS]|uniref:DUF4412 domain-containing protein n=2 Tax=Oxalobacter paraformigenes TaxID=556268 RepID=C3X334_9BURK|nr:hypothetical protein OFAG_00773 [Oxalobacter paraformigenes]